MGFLRLCTGKSIDFGSKFGILAVESPDAVKYSSSGCHRDSSERECFSVRVVF